MSKSVQPQEPSLGWSPVAQVCRKLSGDIAPLTDRLNAAIAREIGEFRPPRCAFTADELFRSTRRCSLDFLEGLAEDRPLSPDEVERRLAIGRQGALRGFPLQPLIGSFHVAYRELWSELVEHAVAIGGDAPLLLLGAGVRVWGWMHATVDAVAEGYDTEGARLEALETRATERFIESLARDGAREESLELSEQCGFDADAAFRVLAITGPYGSLEVARAVAAAAESQGGVAKRAQRGSTTALVVQRLDRSLLDDVLRRSPDGVAIGVGRMVDRIDDVLLSLSESEQAMEIALERGGVCYFEDVWLLALARAGGPSIGKMLERGAHVGRSHPHLAEAVRVFSQSMSMADGARTLRVSHNSFRYRLMRWEHLTGWTPWTLDGLVRSLIALDLPADSARADRAPERSPWQQND